MHKAKRLIKSNRKSEVRQREISSSGNRRVPGEALRGLLTLSSWKGRELLIWPEVVHGHRGLNRGRRRLPVVRS